MRVITRTVINVIVHVNLFRTIWILLKASGTKTRRSQYEIRSRKVVESPPWQKEEGDVTDETGCDGGGECRMLSNAHLNNEYESECAGFVSGHAAPTWTVPAAASGAVVTRAEIQHMNSGLQLNCPLCEGSRRRVHSLPSLKAASFVHAPRREKAVMALSCLPP